MRQSCFILIGILILSCTAISAQEVKSVKAGLKISNLPVVKVKEIPDLDPPEVEFITPLIDLGGKKVLDHGFRWVLEGQEINPGNKVSLGKTNKTGQVSGTLLDLEPSSAYYVWTYIDVGEQEYSAESLEFTTLVAEIPVVVSLDTLFVTLHEAGISGSVISDGSSAVTERGICWGQNPGPVISGEHTASGAGLGEFNGILDELQMGTKYYARAYATNEQGTGYGEDLEFTTRFKEMPTVETHLITVGVTSLEFGGYISNTGSSAIIEKGVLLGEIDNEVPTVENGVLKRIDSGTDVYSTTISGFTHYTVYFIRAYAVNEEGVGYGEPMRLRTLCSCGELLVDPRDQQEYATVQIGGQCWMAENLNVGTFMTIEGDQRDNGKIEKFCYDDNPSNCNSYGGLYTWDEMMQYSLEPTQGVCPEGWHIASDEKWMVMKEFLGVPAEELDYLNQRGDDEGGMLKLAESPPWNEPNALATNSTNFSAWPSGMIFPESGTSQGLGDFTVFWTSSVPGEGLAIYRMLVTGHGGIERWEGNRPNTSSVRCVRE